MARVFSFILKTKHKTLHVKRAWAELENSAQKHSARVSIDRERENYIVNSAVTRFQLYIKRIHFDHVLLLPTSRKLTDMTMCKLRDHKLLLFWIFQQVQAPPLVDL